MFRYFVLRLLGLVPTMLLVTVCVFFFVHLLPGDPAQLAAGPEADEETVQMVRERLGLDPRTRHARGRTAPPHLLSANPRQRHRKQQPAAHTI